MRDRLPAPAFGLLQGAARQRPSHRRWRSRQAAIAQARDRLDDRVVEIVDSDLVQAGPFAGMKMSREAAWGVDFSSRLLGAYERELHPYFRELATPSTPLIVDVGCADGYYVVGLARLAAAARVVAYDIDTEARRVTSELALLNGLADRVAVRSRCRPHDLERLEPGTVVLMDCEGAEAALVTQSVADSNPGVHFIVECHESVVPGVTEMLERRFRGRDVTRVEQSARLPEDTPQLPEDLAVEVLNELRSPADRWLVIR
jgi:hypothetical protein